MLQPGTQVPYALNLINRDVRKCLWTRSQADSLPLMTSYGHSENTEMKASRANVLHHRHASVMLVAVDWHLSVWQCDKRKA